MTTHRHDHYIRASKVESGMLWAVEEIVDGAIRQQITQALHRTEACDSARRHAVALGLPAYLLERIDLPEPEHVPF